MAPTLDARCAFTVQQLQQLVPLWQHGTGGVHRYVYVYTMGGLFMGNENKRSIPSSTCNYYDIQFNAPSKWLAPLVFNAVRIRSDKT
jgi:hypothetical protein